MAYILCSYGLDFHRRSVPQTSSYRHELTHEDNSESAYSLCDDLQPMSCVYNVSFYNEKIQVTVTKRATDVDEWIGEILHVHRYRLQNLVIGLDVEWLPNLRPDDDHPVATLQLCVGHRCLIFQLLHRDYMPPCLRAFLEKQVFTFVGIAIQDDVEKLQLHHGLRVSNFVDLQSLASLVTNDNKFQRMGLKRMASEILNKEMAKPKRVTLSQWDAEDLNEEQVEYACIDAFVSFELGKILHKSLNSVVS